MVVLNWLILLAVSKKYLIIFSVSKVILSDPPHCVMIIRTLLGKEPTLYTRFIGGPILTQDLVGLKTLRNVQPLLIPWVIVETVSDEMAFRVNWLVIKVPLFLCFIRWFLNWVIFIPYINMPSYWSTLWLHCNLL